MLLSPPEQAEPFCDDVRNYLTAVLQDEGFVTPPDVLKIALNADFAEQVQLAYADDPDMFAAIWQTQQSKTKELNDTIQENLQERVTQIAALPLTSGNVEQLLARLPAAMQPA